MNEKKNKDYKKPQKKILKGTAKEYNDIQNVIAVMSGKGGVGKSFVTSLLATALAREKYHVGILDADITGPSIPNFFGLSGPVMSEDKILNPLLTHLGIKVMSMNLLLPNKDQAIIWRGPMISKAITQLWGDVKWGELDYLLIDLPPGTSDAALTIMQSLPLSGILMVTTPQNLSSIIVRKAIHMAQHVGVPIIGIIENMSYFVCPNCGSRQSIFGDSHTKEVEDAAGAPLIAELPINPATAALCDQGKIENFESIGINKILETLIQKDPTDPLGGN
ncbi:MAG: Mrp/NBP35 family ATP-binding protein [Pelolinea sp.]|nr:Mrp/NBP35 family ATP-binding protein [Pelolinea sp.]